MLKIFNKLVCEFRDTVSLKIKNKSNQKGGIILLLYIKIIFNLLSFYYI
jgi:hypothetical protein